MIHLHQGKPGFIADGFIYLGGLNPSIILQSGDRVCYNGSNPVDVAGHGISNPSGFEIKSWAGRTIGQVIEILEPHFIGINNVVLFWRKHTGVVKPKEYIPSEWATPLPLP